MKHTGPLNSSQVVMARVRAERDERGWSAQELADRCQAAGCTTLTRVVISALENGRRDSVNVNELMVFADVLEVAPLDLLAHPSDTKPRVAVYRRTRSMRDYRRWLTRPNTTPTEARD
jgi:transcriptional regulator with XRE-family HTH domain